MVELFTCLDLGYIVRLLIRFTWLDMPFTYSKGQKMASLLTWLALGWPARLVILSTWLALAWLVSLVIPSIWTTWQAIMSTKNPNKLNFVVPSPKQQYLSTF